ncbi:MAG: TIGR03643 family protein [Myxococcota bacterium]|nr:TIGR03643 family protein [Myxococcota bacterium]
MARLGDRPLTRVRKPEPIAGTTDWIIWAAWADRITFEEIRERTGKSENEVIRIMRRNLKPSSFRLWRKRVATQSLKHRRKFRFDRRVTRDWTTE